MRAVSVPMSISTCVYYRGWEIEHLRRAPVTSYILSAYSGEPGPKPDNLLWCQREYELGHTTVVIGAGCQREENSAAGA